MKLTLQVTLSTGVRLTTSREVRVFTDVAQFGRKVMDWANQVRRIAPDLCTDTVESVQVSMEDTPDEPKRKRSRKHARGVAPAAEAAAAHGN